jgi:hypothetical protein
VIELSEKFVALKLNPEDEAHPENQELQQNIRLVVILRLSSPVLMAI